MIVPFALSLIILGWYGPLINDVAKERLLVLL